MNADQLDRLFKEQAAPAKAINLVCCPECGVHHRASLRGEPRCEACRMAGVRDAMKRAKGQGDQVTRGQGDKATPSPSHLVTPTPCLFCSHPGPGICKDDNDRAACRHLAENR